MQIEASFITLPAMPNRREWVLLAYRMPREPSSPRIAVWRKLRRLGVAQIVDGMVALPTSPRNRENFDWIADEIAHAGGEATVWVAQPGSAADERSLMTRMASAIVVEYEELIEEAREAQNSSTASSRRTCDRLSRQLARIAQRDYFPDDVRDQARQAIADLKKVVEVTV